MRDNIFYFYVLVFWTMLGVHAAQGQETRFGHFSLEEGLSQSTVHAIVQDQRGFMWFGTEDGLDRYDGYHFSVFQYEPSDSLSLGSSVIYSLFETRSGELWVGTFDGGLNRFNAESNTFTRFRHDAADSTSISDDTVYAILEDAAGKLWIGTRNGLDRLDRDTGVFRQYLYDADDPNSITEGDVTALLQDRSGMIWVGTWGGGLDRLDPASGTFTHFHHDSPAGSVGSDYIMSLLEDRAGELWIGTDRGLERMDRSTNRLEHFKMDPANPSDLVDDPIAYIFEDDAGTMWVGTGVRWIGTGGSGLYRVDQATGTIVQFRHDTSEPNSLAANDVISLFEDRSGLLWIGTNGGGLSTLNRKGKPFEWYRSDPGRLDGLSRDMVFALHEDRNGIVWVGTLGGGLDRFDPVTGRFTHFRHDPADRTSLANNSVYAIAEDASGHLWVGTEGGGLDRFDRSTGRFTHFRHDPENPHSLSSDVAVTLLVDRTGTLWVGTFDAGMNRFEPETQSFTRFRHDASDPNSLTGDEVRALYQDRSGLLWISTSSGLNRFDPRTERFSGRFSYSADPGSISSNDIMALHEDAGGRLWVGTYGGGLDLFNPATGLFRRFTQQDGLPNNSVYGILEDDEGYLWLSTNRGISRFDPTDAASATSQVRFRNYDKEDGLQSNEFNSGSFARGRRHLYFGGIKGFNRFDPRQIKDNPFVPPIALTAFKIFNEPIDLDVPIGNIQSLSLTPDQNVFSFEFAALNFISPEKNRYAYMLEGFKNTWIPLGNKRDITFTNLDPGDYTFRVKASNNDGVWNDEGLAVRLTIKPPLWRTWWFRGAISAFLVLFVIGVYQIRTRVIRGRNRRLESMNRILERINAELEDKNAELERFTYTVSHDLKSPLFTIEGFVGMLEKDVDQRQFDKVKADLHHIRTGVKTMAQLLDELLELSRVGHALKEPERASPTELAREALRQLEGSLAAKSVSVDVEAEMPPIVVDRARFVEVYQNLVENAIKFNGSQPAPHVVIGCRQDGDEIVFFVRDNGAGVDPRYHAKIFGLFERLDTGTPGTGIGLALVKRIVEMHGGRIWVESDGRGTGSTFCFTAPPAP